MGWLPEDEAFNRICAHSSAAHESLLHFLVLSVVWSFHLFVWSFHLLVFHLWAWTTCLFLMCSFILSFIHFLTILFPAFPVLL